MPAPITLRQNQPGRAGYLDYSGRDDVLGGGVKLIPVKTPKNFSCMDQARRE